MRTKMSVKIALSEMRNSMTTTTRMKRTFSDDFVYSVESKTILYTVAPQLLVFASEKNHFQSFCSILFLAVHRTTKKS